MTSLTLVRRIAARPAIVFDALITPDGISSWWGPDAGPVLVAETDPRVGGRYRCRFRTLGGGEYESSGEYLEVSPPERLAMTWKWLDEAEGAGQMMIVIELRPVAEGTELTFTQSGFEDEDNRLGHEKGWSGSLDKLERRFAGAPAAAKV